MLVSLTVGKVDAGVAVLLTDDKRLIEFPSLLLPPSIQPGSIVDITVSLNTPAYQKSISAFQTLQSSILQTYGLHSPSPPNLHCLNSTQTSVVLAWDELNLATAELRNLTLYRNGQKAGVIPEARARAEGGGKTKVSGLALDTEYTFSLTLKTSGGTYHSERLVVRTHKMTDLSGIVVTPGILPQQLRDSLEIAVRRIGARVIDTVGVETTHFVCTEGRGREWERALEVNIPIVRPEWVEGCEREGRLVGVRGYYLNADPKLRQVGPGMGIGAGTGARGSQQNLPPSQYPQQQQQQQSSPQPQFQQRPVPDRTRSTTASRSSAQPQQHDNPLSSHPPTELKSPTSETKPPSPPAKDTPLRPERHHPSNSQQERGDDGNSDEDEDEGHDNEQRKHDEEEEEEEEGGGGRGGSERSSRQDHRPRDLGISGAGGGVSVSSDADDDDDDDDGVEKPKSGGASFQEVEL